MNISNGLFWGGVAFLILMALVFMALFIWESHNRHRDLTEGRISHQSQKTMVDTQEVVVRENSYVVEIVHGTEIQANGTRQDKNFKVVSGGVLGHIVYTLRNAQGDLQNDVLMVDYQRHEIYVLSGGSTVSGGTLHPLTEQTEENEGNDVTEYEGHLKFYDDENTAALDTATDVLVHWLPSHHLNSGQLIVQPNISQDRKLMFASPLTISELSQILQSDLAVGTDLGLAISAQRITAKE